jgi:hypothetical protein
VARNPPPERARPSGCAIVKEFSPRTPPRRNADIQRFRSTIGKFCITARADFLRENSVAITRYAQSSPPWLEKGPRRANIVRIISMTCRSTADAPSALEHQLFSTDCRLLVRWLIENHECFQHDNATSQTEYFSFNFNGLRYFRHKLGTSFHMGQNVLKCGEFCVASNDTAPLGLNRTPHRRGKRMHYRGSSWPTLRSPTSTMT